nr:YoaK family protein [Acidocella sp. C78]
MPGPTRQDTMMDHANATFLTAADLTLAALAFVSGSADIFAFLKFHDVFTSAMTGNTALLGLALGQGHILAAQRSLAALFGFCCGSIAGTIANEAAARHNRARRLRLLIGAEATCLALVLVLWAITRHPVYGPLLYVMILTGAFAMACKASRRGKSTSPASTPSSSPTPSLW